MLGTSKAPTGRTKGRQWSAIPAALPMAFLMLAAVLCLSVGIEAGSRAPNPIYSTDTSGVLATYRTTGGVDLANPYFKSLGTNGRSCVTCHSAKDAWTVAPPDTQQRFNASLGRDPIFPLSRSH